jgi:hypothetical protein
MTPDRNRKKLFTTREGLPAGPLRPLFSGFSFGTGLNQVNITLQYMGK